MGVNEFDPDSANFARWLGHGRGWAISRSKDVRRSVQEEALLDACTHFTGYDAQCEGTRAEYLFDALTTTGTREGLEASLLETLAHRDSWDREQLLDLAYLFAKDGSTQAEHHLKDIFLQCVAEPSRPGANQVVRACGLPGVLLVASELGRVLPGRGADWEEVHPLDLAEAHYGVEVVASALAQAALQDANVGRFIEAVRVYRAAIDRPALRARAPLPFALTYEGLRDAALSAGKPPGRGHLRRWAREAPEEEAVLAAEALSQVIPSALQLTLLRVFGGRPFPGAPDVLMSSLNHPDDEGVDDTWKALSQVRAEEVQNQARTQLRGPNPDLRALGGLQQNFLREDVSLVSTILSDLTDEEDVHFVGNMVLDTARSSPEVDLSPLLVILYERGNCGICRHSFVTNLHGAGAAPRGLLEECRYDACLELRADATVWLR